MQLLKLAFIGFGNVGQALAKLLLEKREELQKDFMLDWKVVGIATGSHGIAVESDGLDLEEAIGKLNLGEDLSSLSTAPPPSTTFEFIQGIDGDILFENSPVDYESGQPALGYIKTALEKGMHAITANKGPVVHAYQELTDLARQKGKSFLFESAVMDGAPIFSMWREALPGANLKSFKGVLNSTTNLILTLMEEGKTFEEAVSYAQEIGIAETDPSGDIDGWDAAVKVSALVTVLTGISLLPHQVDREGIRDITKDTVRRSLHSGKRWKLVCEAVREGSRVTASVQPKEVEAHDPLFNVMGTSSAVTFQSDVLGALTLLEEDPGPHTTAYGLLADFLNAVR
jgi:homoserine dehydrogenase